MTMSKEEMVKNTILTARSIYSHILNKPELERAIEDGPEKMADILRKWASLSKLMALSLTYEVSSLDDDIDSLLTCLKGEEEYGKP